MRSRSARIVKAAIAVEGALGLAGVAWMAAQGERLVAGPLVSGLVAGAGAAAAFWALQHVLVRRAPDIGPVRALRRLYRELLEPMFADLSPAAIVTISVAAGLGEEILFRGAMQPQWGWLVTSVLFGIVHVGSRATVVLGVWAMLLGGGLGLLKEWTGGLLAPVLAHAAYDAAVLMEMHRARAAREAVPAVEDA